MASHEVSFRCTVVDNLGSSSRYTERLSSELHKVLYRIGLVPMGGMERGGCMEDSERELEDFSRVLRGGNVGIAIHQALKDSVSTSYNRLETGGVASGG